MIWADEHFEELKEEGIASVRAAIALDNFWYYLRQSPDFQDAFVLTDAVAFSMKSSQEKCPSPEHVIL